METNVHLLLFLGFLCFLWYGTGLTSTFELPPFSTPISPIPCDVDFYAKSVQCDRRKLNAIPENLPADIIILDLSQNKLQRLHHDSFISHVSLMELDLSRNNITFIEKSTFAPLKHLRELILTANTNLNIIQSDMFGGSHNLMLLDLAECNITTFPNNTFEWLPRIQKLSLKNNALTFVNTTVCPKKGLSFVDFSENLLESITNDTFTFKCTCDALFLHANPLRVVNPNVIASLKVKTLSVGVGSIHVHETNTTQLYTDLFAGCARSAITELNVIDFDARAYEAVGELSRKSLYVFRLECPNIQINLDEDQYVFQSLPHVKEMHISNSNIKTLRPGLFKGMTDLFALHLSKNRIFTINGSLSSWDVSLLHLDLGANSLFSVDNVSFAGLENLTTLDLSDNRRLFYFSISLPNLKYLNISGTAIGECSEFVAPNLISFSFPDRLPREFVSATFFDTLTRFQGMKFLYHMDISRSKMYLSELFDAVKIISLFEGLANLTSLYLQINNIQGLQAGMFPGLSSLYELNLRQCQITYVEESVFKDLHSLAILHLDDNSIVSLPPAIFATTLKMMVVYLHQNRLSYLAEELFDNTTMLTNLTLFRNELIHLNQSTFTPIMSSITTVDLSENPFQCSCELKWLVQWLRSSKTPLQINRATCSPALDNTLKGVPLTSIDPSTLCPSYLVLYLLVPFIAIASLVIIAIIHHYRWLIRYKVFLLRLAVLGYREINDVQDHMNFRYDLNIMFTDEDEQWASKFFRPHLEEKLPQFQRIAFGDAALPLTMYTLDAFQFIIENSFRSILLLSKAAMQDIEFMMKFRVALNHMANTDMQNTVLIFLEDLPEDEMPYLVKMYLSEQKPHIDWVEEERGQVYFWKQLSKLLTMSLRDTDDLLQE